MWGQHEKFCNNTMIPNKEGQVVKFHTPNPDEDPNQKYVILEIHKDLEKPRALIRELNGGLPLASTHIVFVDDLEVSFVSTSDLIGHKVKISKADNFQLIGKVLQVEKEKIIPELKVVENGVETNVLVTIIDEFGVKHSGNLFVSPDLF